MNGELTTGVIQHLGNNRYLIEADGVSIGKKDPDGHWVPFPLGSVDAGGLTVPTEAMKRDLNGLKDPNFTTAEVSSKQESIGEPEAYL